MTDHPGKIQTPSGTGPAHVPDEQESEEDDEEDADPKQMIEHFFKLVDDGFDIGGDVWDAMEEKFSNWDGIDGGIEPIGVLCDASPNVVALEGPNGYRIFDSVTFKEYDIKDIFNDADPAQQWNQGGEYWMDVDVPDYEPAPEPEDEPDAGPVKKVSPPKTSPITEKLQPKVMIFLQTCSDDQYKKFTEHMGVDGGQVGKWKAGKGIGSKHSEKIKKYINTTAVYGDLTKGYKWSDSDKGDGFVSIEGKEFKMKTILDVMFIYVTLSFGPKTKDILVGIIDKKDGLAHFTQKGTKYQK